MTPISIFVSSPGDVAAERGIARDVIDDFGRLRYINQRLAIRALLFEREAPPLAGAPAQQTVDEYMGTAADADIYICILSGRMGTPLTDPRTTRSYPSGTAYEFDCAYRARARRRGRPVMLLYRRAAQANAAASDGGEGARVTEFFSQFEGPDARYQGLWKAYDTPAELRNELYIDLQNVLEQEFLAAAGDGGGRDAAEYFRHVEMPPHYVVREEVMLAARQALLADAPTPADGRGARTVAVALHGMGGAGKSVVARALCDEDALRSAFADGILWAALRPDSDVRAVLLAWLLELGATVPERTATIDTLRNEVGKALAERACLLVVDNVRYPGEAGAFQLGGPRCALLLTTRDAALAREVGAQVITVPMMTLAEAVVLLRRWGEHGVYGADDALLRDIVQRLGRLPLALKLAGAQLRNALDSKRWLEDFDAIRLRSARPSRVADPHDSLADTIELSLADLPGQTRSLYRDLVVLRDVGGGIPIAAIRRLWSSALGANCAGAVHQVLVDLADRALIDYLPGDDATRVRIHDLLRDILDRELDQEGGPQQRHRNLLHEYRPGGAVTRWPAVQDDGYLYRHLVHHLRGAGAQDEIAALLRDDEWMRVRVDGDGMRYDGFVADLEVALAFASGQAKQQVESGQQPSALPGCLRLVLVRASIKSISGNFRPALVLRAVALGIWSIERAAATAAQIPDALARVTFYARLLDTGHPHEGLEWVLRSRIVSSVRAIQDDARTAQAVAIAAHLEDPHLAQALLGSSLDIEQEEQRAKALLALAPRVPDAAVEGLLSAAECLEWSPARVQLLCAIAPRLSPARAGPALASALAAGAAEHGALLDTLARVLPESWFPAALDAVDQLEEDWRKGEIETALAIRAPAGRLVDALDRALARAPGFARDEAVLALLPRLAGGGAALERARTRAVDSLVASAHRRNQRGRDGLLVPIAPYLVGSQTEVALAAVESMEPEVESDVAAKARALAAMVPALESAAAFRRALDIAKGLFLARNQAIALKALCPRLPLPLQREALAFSTAGDFESEVAERLAAIAPALAVSLLPEAVTAALQIEDEAHRSAVLAALAARACGAQRERIVEAAFGIESQPRRCEVLVALAPGGSQAYLERALDAARGLQDWELRTWTLVELAPSFPAPLRERILSDCRSLGKALDWVAVLEALASDLDAALASRALEQATRIDAGEYSEWLASRAVAALASHLGPRPLARALDIVRGFSDASAQADALAALIPRLPAASLPEATERVLALDDPTARVKPLFALSRHPDDAVLAATLELAAASMHADDLDTTLRTLAAARSGERAVETTEDAIRELRRLGSVSTALDTLAPCLPLVLLTPALEAARYIDDVVDEVDALAAFTIPLPRPVLEAVLGASASIDDPPRIASALRRLGPRLVDDESAGLELIASMEPESARAIALGGAAATLGRDRQPAAWRIAAGLQDRELRCQTTIVLLRDLPDPEPRRRRSALEGALADLDAKTASEPGLWSVLAAIGARVSRAEKSLLLAAAAGVEDRWHRLDAQCALLPLVPASKRAECAARLLDAALAAPPDFLAEALRGSEPRYLRDVERVLPKLLAFLDEASAADALDRLKGVVEPFFERLLPALLPHVRGRRQRELFELGMRMDDGSAFAGVIRKMAPRLSPAQARRALEHTLDLDSQSQRAELLFALAPRLGRNARRRALDAARQLDDAQPRFAILWETALRCTGDQRKQHLEATLDAALDIPSGRRKAQALSRLAEHLDAPGLERAFQAALDVDDEKSRVEAMVAFSPHIGTTGVLRGFHEALEIGNAGDRLEALNALVARLDGAEALDAEDRVGMARAARLAVIEVLLASAEGERRDVLALLRNQHLFGPPLLAADMSRCIAETVSAVCHSWRWR